MGLNDDELTPGELTDMRDRLQTGTRRIRPAGAHRTAFITAAVAVVLVAGVAAGALALTNVFGTHYPMPVATVTSSPSPSPSPSPTRTPTPTPTPTLAPTPTVPPMPAATCDNTTTGAWRDSLGGWVSWEREGVVDTTFGIFPGGTPAGAIVCFWGQGPDVPTDNIAVLGWAPLAADERDAAEQAVIDAGYSDRIDAPEGVYFVDTRSPGYDASYLFTNTDVRWADRKARLDDVQAPEAGG
jgi:hypothetical protein